jgi:hypothetical protein
MITKPQVIPMLVEACPSFRPGWEQHLRENGEEILYVALGDFARHLLELFQARKTESFPGVAHVIERLYVEGEPYVREAATIGLLEGIQNVWGNNNVDPELFFPLLLPESARWWKSLNKFWSGESKHVGEGL